MSVTRQSYVHLWLRGDRIACLACGALAEDVEFVDEDRPLCGDCRAALLGDGEDSLPW